MKYRVIDEYGDIYEDNLTLRQAENILYQARDRDGLDWHIEKDDHRRGERKLLFWSVIAGVLAALVGS